MMKKFLDLGRQPIANAYLTKEDFANEFFYNLEVGFDEETKLVSLINQIKPEKMFVDDYPYHSSSSSTMKNHFKEAAQTIKTIFGNDVRVLEIGSNDGVFLKNFDKNKAVAVEPCKNFAQMTNEMGYRTYDEFWTESLAEKICGENGSFDVVYSANCLCHMPSVFDAYKAIFKVLKSGGTLISECPSMFSVLKNTAYDQLYNEHPHLLSLTSTNNLLKEAGFSMINSTDLECHGGSYRVFAGKGNYFAQIDGLDKEKLAGLHEFSTYERFAQKVEKSKTLLRGILEGVGGKTISYGATAKSSTVFNYCGIDSSLISYIVDTTKEKQGKFSPGVHIPIISREEANFDDVSHIFLGAWNYLKEIREKEKTFNGNFITHVPFPNILPSA